MSDSNIDSSGVIVSCSQCGRANRLRFETLNRQTRCANCKNDLAAAAALAILSEIDDAHLVERARTLGDRLLERTRPLVERHEVVTDVRGLGLMWAIELGPPSGGSARRIWDSIERRQPGLAAQLLVVPLFRDHRILTQVAGHHMNVVKALPPLVITEEEIDRFTDAVDQAVGRFESLGRSMARLTLGMAWRGIRRRPTRAGAVPPPELA
jgi:4-aminobutyrate aminotransferase-like enzyme